MTGIAKTVVIRAVVLMALTGTAGAQPPVLIGFAEGETRLAVRRAVEGAVARLADPRCQDVLSDFADEWGQPLGARLRATRKTPAQALQVLRFFDDGMAPQCQAGPVMAFTHPGSQVIRVCGRQFRDGNRAAALGWPSCRFATQSTEAVAGQASEMAPRARVRGGSARIVAIINTARAQSGTFRGLVDQINHLDGMVYVAEGNCGSGVRACLLLTMTTMGAHRVLRILVHPRVADRDLMASIGHELQHAVEVLSYRSVRTTSEMILLYKRICDVCGPFIETNAAVRAGNMVRDELR